MSVHRGDGRAAGRRLLHYPFSVLSALYVTFSMTCSFFSLLLNVIYQFQAIPLAYILYLWPISAISPMQSFYKLYS